MLVCVSVPVHARPPSLHPSRDAPVAHFTWHKAAITSIEWSPDDENALVVASADHSVSLWDMSLEQDDEAEIAHARAAGLDAAAVVPSSLDPALAGYLPPQLLF